MLFTSPHVIVDSPSTLFILFFKWTLQNYDEELESGQKDVIVYDNPSH